jgi:hypothetical protein
VTFWPRERRPPPGPRRSGRRACARRLAARRGAPLPRGETSCAGRHPQTHLRPHHVTLRCIKYAVDKGFDIAILAHLDNMKEYTWRNILQVGGGGGGRREPTTWVLSVRRGPAGCPSPLQPSRARPPRPFLARAALL